MTQSKGGYTTYLKKLSKGAGGNIPVRIAERIVQIATEQTVNRTVVQVAAKKDKTHSVMNPLSVLM